MCTRVRVRVCCASPCVHQYVSPASESVGRGWEWGGSRRFHPATVVSGRRGARGSGFSEHRSLGPALTPPQGALRVWGEKAQALWDSWPEKDPQPTGKLGPTRGAEAVREGPLTLALWEAYEDAEWTDRQSIRRRHSPAWALILLFGTRAPDQMPSKAHSRLQPRGVILGPEGKAQNTAPFIPHPAESQTQYNFPMSSPFSGPGWGTGRGEAESRAHFTARGSLGRAFRAKRRKHTYTQ